MDKLTKEQRHRCMASIRGKGTKPEILVRKYLFSRGFRYRLNHPRLPGHPDIVLRKYRSVVFVNGCFWHGHEGCKFMCFQRQMWISGEQRLSAIVTVTWRNSANLQRWVGIALRFGNAS